jgi:hypothetical protein
MHKTVWASEHLKTGQICLVFKWSGYQMPGSSWNRPFVHPHCIFCTLTFFNGYPMENPGCQIPHPFKARKVLWWVGRTDILCHVILCWNGLRFKLEDWAFNLMKWSFEPNQAKYYGKAQWLIFSLEESNHSSSLKCLYPDSSLKIDPFHH